VSHDSLPTPHLSHTCPWEEEEEDKVKGDDK